MRATNAVSRGGHRTLAIPQSFLHTPGDSNPACDTQADPILHAKSSAGVFSFQHFAWSVLENSTISAELNFTCDLNSSEPLWENQAGRHHFCPQCPGCGTRGPRGMYWNSLPFLHGSLTQFLGCASAIGPVLDFSGPRLECSLHEYIHSQFRLDLSGSGWAARGENRPRARTRVRVAA